MPFVSLPFLTYYYGCRFYSELVCSLTPVFICNFLFIRLVIFNNPQLFDLTKVQIPMESVTQIQCIKTRLWRSHFPYTFTPVDESFRWPYMTIKSNWRDPSWVKQSQAEAISWATMPSPDVNMLYPVIQPTNQYKTSSKFQKRRKWKTLKWDFLFEYWEHHKICKPHFQHFHLLLLTHTCTQTLTYTVFPCLTTSPPKVFISRFLHYIKWFSWYSNRT